MNAAVGSQVASLLEALHEPAMLLYRDGLVFYANRALKRVLGSETADRAMFDLTDVDTAAELDRYLSRCLGSGDPLVGSLCLLVKGRSFNMQCKGSAVRFEDENLVLLRLSDPDDSRFSTLTKTLGELREELKSRRHSEAMLEESVREQVLLHRELEHRVKNNMQMLSALLSGAERETNSAEAKAALRNASLRFSAVRTVQQLLYRSDDLQTIGSQPLVNTLMDAIAALSPEPLQTEINVEPIDLPIETAVPLGLILNELLTNAVKYGRPPSGVQKLRVDFVSHEDKIRLAVQDNGLGFDLSESPKRASGIGLVRGLLRQLGGSFEVGQAGGTQCLATFPMPRGSVFGVDL